MVSAKKAFLILTAIFMVIPGAFVANYSFDRPSYGNPMDSTVYVENGISGMVKITDPFLKKTSEFNIDYYPLSTGSGVIVTSDGYIITAFHVIGDPKTSNEQNRAKRMEKGDIANYLEKAAVNDYINNYNPHLDEELLNTENLSNVNDLDYTTQILKQKNLLQTSSVKQVIKVKIPHSGGINSIYTYDAQIVDTGDTNKNQDMALLKINPIKSLPTLKISPKNPLIGEKIRIYGYPGNKMNSKNKKFMQPYSSSGLLTSVKPGKMGTTYYQTSAATAKGYSGGPVINSQNQIVGIIIYGIQRQSYFGNQIKSDSCLFLSSKHLINMCKKNNVNIGL